MTALARGHRPLRSCCDLPPHEIVARFRRDPGLVIGARS